MNDPIISLKNVHFCYDGQDQEALQNINLSVRAGELIVLTGDSGCGKSSLLRLVNGLIPHFFEGNLRGSVRVCGQKTAETSIGDLGQNVASIFQDTKSQFFTTNTMSETVFAAQNYGVPVTTMENRLQTEFNQFGLEKIWNRDIFSLSSGQRQKLAFAGAEILNPNIYLLDEPSANLDLASIRQLRARLNTLKEEGKTILIAEHRLFYLDDMADRIVLLKEGSITAISYHGLKGLPEKLCQSLRAASLKNLEYHQPAYHPGSPLLSWRGINHTFHKKQLLKNISANLCAGEVVTVIGSNGVGKTTFCKIVAGLLKAQKGSFSFQGLPVRINQLYRYSFFVMQETDYQLYTESCMSELTFGQADTDKITSLAEKTLQELSMDSFKKTHPQALSGGQKQRIVIASAICSSKPILIFDEPTSGLDFKNMVNIARILKREAEKGKVVLVITHDIELMSYISKRILEITADGTLREHVLSSQDDFSRLCQYMLESYHEI